MSVPAFNFDGRDRLLTSRDLDEITDPTSDMGAAFDAAAAVLVQAAAQDLIDNDELVPSDVADAAYVHEGAAFADISKYDGVDNTGVTECATEINAALVAIKALGQRAYAQGTFKIASTIVIQSSVDFGDATFNYTPGTGTAIRVGSLLPTATEYIWKLDVTLPQVYATAKTVLGWAEVAGTIGVEIANLYSSRVRVPYIVSFEIGLQMRGIASGCVYNEVSIGHLDNNKVNMKMTADATGWTNENLIVGGRYSQNSAEGAPAVGTSHIYTDVTANKINNNVWMKPSLEGFAVENNVYMGGMYNRIVQGRWESPTPQVTWASDAFYNVIDGGYDSSSITEIFEVGASGANQIVGHQGSFITKSLPAVLENNNSSNNPVDVIMYAGQRGVGDWTTAYAVRRCATSTKMKRTADADSRLTLDHSNGRLYLGDGTVAPTVYLQGEPGYLSLVGGSVIFLEDNTRDIGTATYRPRDIYIGRNARIYGALDHDGTTVGFYGITPVTRPTAYTQTYSTADKTHAAPTAATLSMADGAGTNDNTIGAITADASVIAAFQELVDENNKLVADLADAKQLLNSVIDDLQALGLFQ